MSPVEAQHVGSDAKALDDSSILTLTSTEATTAETSSDNSSVTTQGSSVVADFDIAKLTKKSFLKQLVSK